MDHPMSLAPGQQAFLKSNPLKLHPLKSRILSRLAAAIVLSSPLACMEQNGTAPFSTTTTSSTGVNQPLFDLDSLPSTQPASVSEPRVIEDGDKSTLIYKCRNARPETLHESIEGL